MREFRQAERVNLRKCNCASCAKYAERRGWRWTIVSEYVDVGISGAKDRRPELDRLMQDAHRRKCDVVACWKFDRVARSVSHLLRALETFQAADLDLLVWTMRNLLELRFWAGFRPKPT